jgi:5'-nucleotidase
VADEGNPNVTWSRCRAVVVSAIALVCFTVLPTPANAATSGPRITVLVTNDDGVTAPGIDALVDAVHKAHWVKVIVVTPAANKSGTGSTTTPGTLNTHHAKTASGFPAIAVDGYPADTITVALDQLHATPNVVLSGINAGQNLGPVTDGSGTVGAAKMAVRRGLPAVAFSQEAGASPQYASTAKLAIAWLRAHRSSLSTAPTAAPTTVVNYNVPNCPSGKSRGVKIVQTARTTRGKQANPRCSGGDPNPTTDVEAFNLGYAAVAPVPVT